MIYGRIKSNILRILAIIMVCISVSACGVACLTMSSEQVDQEVKDNCFSCALFEIVYSSASQLAAKVYNNVLPSASNFLAWGFMLWLAIEVAKFAGSVKAPNVGEFWKKVLFKFLLCGLCIIIVRNTSSMLWLVNTVIIPIFIGFIDFADAIMSGSGSCAFNAAQNAHATATEALSGEPSAALSCLIGELHVKLAFGKSLGRALICHPESTMSMTIVGFLFIVAFSAVGVVFPFYTIDCIIRLGLALSLLPLFVMAYPFDATRKFSGKGMVLFLDAGMTLAIISVCMTLVTGVIYAFLESNYPQILTSTTEDLSAVAGPGVGTLTLFFLVVLIFSAVSISASIAQGIVDSRLPNGVVGSAMKGIKFAFTVVSVVAPATKKFTDKAMKGAEKLAGDGNGN